MALAGVAAAALVLAEMDGKVTAPSFAEILALLPADRTVVVRV